MSEESMIERVAKVIELAARNSAVTIYGGYKGETLEQFVANTYLDEEDASELFGNAAKDAARAAIEEMRLPDKAMIDAGATAAEDALDSDIDSGPEGEAVLINMRLRSDAPATIWQAMIDKALT